MTELVWTVGTRAQVYHKDRSCIIKRREDDSLDVEPREVTLEQAKRRDLRECSHCCGDAYDRDNVGGGISQLERILREQDQQVEVPDND